MKRVNNKDAFDIKQKLTENIVLINLNKRKIIEFFKVLKTLNFIYCPQK